MTHRIGVISDTHGLLRDAVKEHLSGCDGILHAGDIGRQEVLDSLKEIAPVYAVRGNCDREWAEYLPGMLSVKLYGVLFFLIHNRKQIAADLLDNAVVVFGHSHRYEERTEDGRLWLNPGSCGPRRFSLPLTMAVIEVGDGGYRKIVRIDLAANTAKPGRPNADAGKVSREIIEAVMKGVDAGRSVEEIAKRIRIGTDLTEQLCRLYLTHPGIRADGILDKLRQ